MYHKKKFSECRDRWKKLGLCVSCGKSPVLVKTWCEECREYTREWDKKQKDEVFAAYGGYKCNCPGCSETHPEFMTIDHIDGNGSRHRREANIKSMYRWLKKNNFPPGFQVLCMNCNFVKRHGKTCPHLREHNEK
jgi:hypothetical protein